MYRMTLTPTEYDRDHMKFVLDYWAQLPDIVADQMWELALGAFTERVERIFDMEGEPTWEPLSATTIRERAMVGYAADPILQREGVLKDSLTVPGLGAQVYVDEHVWFKGGPTRYTESHRTGNVQEETGGGGTHSFRFGTLDDRFIWLSEGDDDMPGRDMVPMGGQRTEVGREAERRIIEKMNEWSNPDG